jgi:hypothetical protein
MILLPVLGVSAVRCTAGGADGHGDSLPLRRQFVTFEVTGELGGWNGVSHFINFLPPMRVLHPWRSLHHRYRVALEHFHRESKRSRLFSRAISSA